VTSHLMLSVKVLAASDIPAPESIHEVTSPSNETLWPLSLTFICLCRDGPPVEKDLDRFLGDEAPVLKSIRAVFSRTS